MSTALTLTEPRELELAGGLPAVVTKSGEHATSRVIEFFTDTIGVAV